MVIPDYHVIEADGIPPPDSDFGNTRLELGVLCDEFGERLCYPSLHKWDLDRKRDE